METSPAWPWLYELLSERHRVRARARQEASPIAEVNYKSDEIDAEVLGRMWLALITEVPDHG